MINKEKRDVIQMDRDSHLSRVKKYKKRRSVKRSIIALSIVGFILLFSVIVMTFTAETDDQAKENENRNTDSEEQLVEDDLNNDEVHQMIDDQESTDEEQTGDQKDESDHIQVNNHLVEPKDVPSDDPNVIVAKEGEWQPIGTIQEEPHVVTFEKDSIDWQEMVAAIESVVNIDDMVIHWLGNGGEQKAVGTVSNQDKTENYRVYISWVMNEGWQPTRVEQLHQLEIIK